MAEIRIRFIGRKEFQREMERAAVRFNPELAKNVRKAGEIIIGQARKEFKGERTRARFKISGGRRVTRKPPRAVTSPPGKLGVFEGTYRKQISQSLSRSGKSIKSEIGPVGVPYARRHELGTQGMPRRQVLTPAVKKTEKDVVRILGRTFGVVIR